MKNIIYICNGPSRQYILMKVFSLLSLDRNLDNFSASRKEQCIHHLYGYLMRLGINNHTGVGYCLFDARSVQNLYPDKRKMLHTFFCLATSQEPDENILNHTMYPLILSLLFILANPLIGNTCSAPYSSESITITTQNDWQYLGEVTGYRENRGNWDTQRFRVYVSVIGGVPFYRAEVPHNLGSFSAVVKNPDYQNTKSVYAKYNYYVDWAGGRWYCNLQ